MTLSLQGLVSMSIPAGSLLQVSFGHGAEVVSLQLFGLTIDILKLEASLTGVQCSGVNDPSSLEIMVEKAWSLS